VCLGWFVEWCDRPIELGLAAITNRGHLLCDNCDLLSYLRCVRDLCDGQRACVSWLVTRDAIAATIELSQLEHWWRSTSIACLVLSAIVVIFWQQRPNISSLESLFGGRPRLKVVGFVRKCRTWLQDCWIPRLALRQRFVIRWKHSKTWRCVNAVRFSLCRLDVR